METSSFLSIGKFAKYCGVSVQSIHFYEKKNLLKPAYIDPESGYRYFQEGQAPVVLSIKALQRSSFSLDDIKAYMTSDNIKILESIHKKNLQQTTEMIDELCMKKIRMESRLELFDEYNNFSNSNDNNLKIKTLPQRTTIFSSINDEVFSLDLLLRLSKDILALEKKYNIATFEPLYYAFLTPFDTKKKCSIELHCRITSAKSLNYSFVKTLASDLYACKYYLGHFAGIQQAEEKFISDIKALGYKVVYPLYAKRIISGIHTKKDKLLMELQIRIESKK